jgi:Phosphatidylinositol-specific phospholipase C, X domain
LDVQDGGEQRRGELIPTIQPIPRDDQPHQQHQDHHQPHLLKLQRVLLVVNNYLTKHPQTYPIILCIENNCSQPYQDAMANMIKSTFGTRLFIPNDTQRTTELPSPEELKGMVLLQAKRPPDPDTKPVPLDENGKGASKFSFMNALFDQFDDNVGVSEE